MSHRVDQAGDRLAEGQTDDEQDETHGPVRGAALPLGDLARSEHEHQVEDRRADDRDERHERGAGERARLAQGCNKLAQVEERGETVKEVAEEPARDEDEWRDEGSTLKSRQRRQAKTGDDRDDRRDDDRQGREVVGQANSGTDVVDGERQCPEQWPDRIENVAAADETADDTGLAPCAEAGGERQEADEVEQPEDRIRTGREC